MAENNAPQTPHLNFARLDDEDRDYDAPSVSDEGRFTRSTVFFV